MIEKWILSYLEDIPLPGPTFPMKILLAILLTAAVISVILMSQSTIKLYRKLTQPGPARLFQPSPETNTVKNPTFMESCYTYENFTASNTCCKLKKYSGSDILKCSRELFAEQILRNRQVLLMCMTNPLFIIINLISVFNLSYLSRYPSISLHLQSKVSERHREAR